MNKADKSFDHLKTLKSLKYKILKYAPAKYRHTTQSSDPKTNSQGSQNSVDSTSNKNDSELIDQIELFRNFFKFNQSKINQ